MHADIQRYEASSCIVTKTEADVRWLVRGIVRPSRPQPVVCLTARHGETTCAFDPDAVRRIVGSWPVIYVLPTDDVTSALCRNLPTALGVDNGAARIFWPGASAESAWEEHPIIVDPTREYADEALNHLRRAWQDGPREIRTSVDEERDRLQQEHTRLLRRIADFSSKLARMSERATIVHDRLAELQRDQRREVVSPAERPAGRDADAAQNLLDEIRQAASAAKRPMRPISLGRDFVTSIDNHPVLWGEEVVEVAAQIACRVIVGLGVRDLPVGAGAGKPQRVRARDGARAKSAALKRFTPDAPRLLWWELPDGGIELANVVDSDDTSITE